MDEAASRSEALKSYGTELVIEQTVTGGPEGKRTYHIAFGAGSASVRPGSADEPTVAFTVPYERAAAIARGEDSALAAFMAGDLKLVGEVPVLLDHHEAFVALDDVFGEVRDRTRW